MTEKKALYTPSQVTNFILTKANKYNITIGLWQLFKIIHVLSEEIESKFNERLVSEDFIASKRGPIISSLLHEFKRFGGCRPITEFSVAHVAGGDMGDIFNPFIEINNDQQIICAMTKCIASYLID